MSVQGLDIYRQRWHRFRESLDLADRRDVSFGRGGVAAKLPTDFASVMLLIADEDPEMTKITLSPETAAWWEEAARPIVGGLPGSTSSGLLRWTEIRDGEWGEFVQLHWSGALQRAFAMGVSRKPFVYLLPLVREIRKAITFYHDQVLPRTGARGPWEFTICLRDIEGSILQPFSMQGGYLGLKEQTCDDNSLLVRIETAEFAPEEVVRHLAFRIAACWSIGPDLVERAFDQQREKL